MKGFYAYTSPARRSAVKCSLCKIFIESKDAVLGKFYVNVCMYDMYIWLDKILGGESSG